MAYRAMNVVGKAPGFTTVIIDYIIAVSLGS